MRKKNFCLTSFIIIILCVASLPAFAQDGVSSGVKEGNWIWGVLTDSVLAKGTGVVRADAGKATTIYAGGEGFVAVSMDSGLTWTESLSFQGSGDSDDDEEAQGGNDRNREVIAARRREFIHQEIENQFGSSDYADTVMDDITDDELVEAKDISDIEELDKLNLEMDPDLSHIPVGETVDGAASVSLSDLDSFVEHYEQMLSAGADADLAIESAGASGGVWDIVSVSDRTYAVTSGNVYVTEDFGDHWNIMVSSLGDNAILSLAIDDRRIYVGMTNGLVMSRDGGLSWEDTGDNVEGAVFELHAMDSVVWAATTHGIYVSEDGGGSWDVVSNPLPGMHVVHDLVIGEGGAFMAVAGGNLYVSHGNGIWDEIDRSPFAEETVRQVVSEDRSLAHFWVRTDAHVFEHRNGWIAQSRALFTDKLGMMSLMRDGISLAIMSSDAGVWLAQDFSVIEQNPEYQALQNQWSREPSNEMVLQKALDAHYLGDVLEKRWGLRSRLSWLLPTVEGNFLFKQSRTDSRKIVTNNMKSIDESDAWTSTRETRKNWYIMGRWTIDIEKKSREMASVSAQMQRLRSYRYDIVRKVNAELNRRHALQISLALELPKIPENASGSTVKGLVKKQIRARLGLEEAEAKLNYLTDGYYIPAVHGN